MNRSGSTWQYNIVSDLLEKREIAIRVGFVNDEDELCRLIRDSKSYIIKTHKAFKIAKEDIQFGSARAMYIHRDLRDVAASLMVKSQKRFVEIIEQGTLLSIIDNHKKWTSVSGILIQSYEKMMENQAESILQIARYLDVKIGNEEVSDLLNEHSIEQTKKKIDGLLKQESFLALATKRLRPVVNRFLKTITGKDKARILAGYFKNIGIADIDSHSLLHTDHINKGEVGAWKKVMNKKEQKMIEAFLSKHN